MEMQLEIQNNPLLGQMWLSAHWDKKLTRTVIKNYDIQSSVRVLKTSKALLALRTCGYLLFGLVKIYYKRVYVIIYELETQLREFNSVEPKKPKEYNYKKPPGKPKKLPKEFPAVRDSVESARKSVEIPRNRASYDQITLSEKNYTPASLQVQEGKLSELEASDSFLDDLKQSAQFQDEYLPVEIDPLHLEFTPKSLDHPPKRTKKTLRNTRTHSYKKYFFVDENTQISGYEKLNRGSSDILKTHAFAFERENSLDANSFLHKPLLRDLHPEVSVFFTQVKKQARDFEPMHIDEDFNVVSSPVGLDFGEESFSKGETLNEGLEEDLESFKNALASKLENGPISYNKAFSNASRVEAAQNFYRLLVLSNKGLLELKQEAQEELYISLVHKHPTHQEMGILE